MTSSSSRAALVVAGKISPDDTLLPLVVAITANILVRTVLARRHGVAAFSRIVVPGPIVSGLAARAGWLASVPGGEIAP